MFLKPILKIINWVIAATAIIGIVLITYFNVQAWIRVLQGRFNIPYELSILCGFSIFALIQGMEIRPLFLKALHNRNDQLLDLAQRESDEDAKALANEIREEIQIRPKKLRRAKKMAYIFTCIDLACCVFLLFVPIIRPGVSIWTVVLTMGMGLIVWENLFKTIATVWLFPWLCVLILAESSEVTLTNLKKILESAKNGARERMSVLSGRQNHG